MPSISEVHDELEAFNREREETAAAQKARAVEMAQVRNQMYLDACAKRDSIRQAGIADGQVVYVYDPDLLDAETLEVLAHMGTPVPPLSEIYPNGVIIPGKQ